MVVVTMIMMTMVVIIMMLITMLGRNDECDHSLQ